MERRIAKATEWRRRVREPGEDERAGERAGEIKSGGKGATRGRRRRV